VAAAAALLRRVIARAVTVPVTVDCVPVAPGRPGIEPNDDIRAQEVNNSRLIISISGGGLSRG